MTYAGPRAFELPELLERQRTEHRRQVLFMRACRLSGNGAGMARAELRARLARLQIRYLKACEKRVA